ncbi:reverse transcriptase family protein [Ancrocorticia populi]|uniref:RNA-directed DNA polymerase n=3 Tax=Ancrocorticia populi TaxID=2175228 RepID=A0A2V1K673_9ACTO|nr:reverse transcriptase family protein [Ancrocorticia populi]PWF25743.1 hypothetical protein DD236_09885 [Ancrocorticia populi]
MSKDPASVASLGELATLTETPYWYLRSIVERRTDPYMSLQRAKRGGGVRPISAPEPPLMHVQRWILHNVLDGLDEHSASYAYRRGRSIAHCAKAHVGARWLVKMDIHNFFGTVTEQRVYKVFRDLGYERLISLEMARLCTREEMKSSTRAPGFRYTAVPSYVSGTIGVLPQGAPTSGALANAVATRIDRALSGLLGDRGITYTRYSDDLTFSTRDGFDRVRASDLISQVTGVVQSCGFQVHKKKTHVVPPGARHVVLGLLVTENNVRLLPEIRRRIEQHVRGVEGFGVRHHADHRGFDDPSAMIGYVGGCLSFALSVDPDWAAPMYRRWMKALSAPW